MALNSNKQPSLKTPQDLLGVLEVEIVGLYDLPPLRTRNIFGINTKRKWTPFITISYGLESWKTKTSMAHTMTDKTIQEEREGQDWTSPRIAMMKPESHDEDLDDLLEVRRGVDFYWQCPPIPVYGATKHWDLVFTAYDDAIPSNHHIGESLNLETVQLVRDWYLGTGGLDPKFEEKLSYFSDLSTDKVQDRLVDPGTEMPMLTEDELPAENHRFEDLILGVGDVIRDHPSLQFATPPIRNFSEEELIKIPESLNIPAPSLTHTPSTPALDDDEAPKLPLDVAALQATFDDDVMSDTSEQEALEELSHHKERRIFGLRRPMFVERDYHVKFPSQFDHEGNIVNMRPMRLRLKFAFNPYKNLMRNLLVSMLYGTTRLASRREERERSMSRNRSPSPVQRVKRVASDAAQSIVNIFKRNQEADPDKPAQESQIRKFFEKLSTEDDRGRSISPRGWLRTPSRQSRSISPNVEDIIATTPSPAVGVAKHVSSTDTIESMTDTTATLTRLDLSMIYFYLNMAHRMDPEEMERFFAGRDRVPVDEVVEAMDEKTFRPLTPYNPEEAQNIMHIESSPNCSLCGQPWPAPPGMENLHDSLQWPLRVKVDHMLVCASLDYPSLARKTFWKMGDFLTSELAGRKWISRWFGRFGFGTYSIGANDAYILVQNRETGRLEEELIPFVVRLSIRLLYQGSGVKSLVDLQAIKTLFHNMSIKQGIKYSRTGEKAQAQIREYVGAYNIDLSELQKPLKDFETFNEFFARKLAPNARPCAFPNDLSRIVSGADCRLTVHNHIDSAKQVWIKGRNFNVTTLLNSQEMGKLFDDCSIAIHRLAPQDYHRYHSPIDGEVVKIVHVPGAYYTVNPMAIRSHVDVFGENVRDIVFIQSPLFGLVAWVCVGAMMVASNVLTVKIGDKIKRTDEIGYFQFGGSTCLLLIQKGLVEYDKDILVNSEKALETLVKVGEGIGRATSSPCTSSSSGDEVREESN